MRRSEERKRRLREYEMKPGLRGMTLSWVEVNTAYAAVVKAINETPRGCFASHHLVHLKKRLAIRKDLNDQEINKVEGSL